MNDGLSYHFEPGDVFSIAIPHGDDDWGQSILFSFEDVEIERVVLGRSTSVVTVRILNPCQVHFGAYEFSVPTSVSERVRELEERVQELKDFYDYRSSLLLGR